MREQRPRLPRAILEPELGAHDQHDIDIAGLRHTFNNLENDALYMLSRDTGGRVIANRNDLVEAVDTLMKAQRVAYVLGFRQGNRKQGRVTVRVTGAPRGSEVS